MKKIMRFGTPILLVIAIVSFAVTLAYQLVILGDVQNAAATGMYQGPNPPTWLSMITAFGSGLSAAAAPFFGACILDRADQWLAIKRKEAAE